MLYYSRSSCIVMTICKISYSRLQITPFCKTLNTPLFQLYLATLRLQKLKKKTEKINKLSQPHGLFVLWSERRPPRVIITTVICPTGV